MKKLVICVCVLLFAVSQLAFAETEVSPKLQKLMDNRQQLNDLAYRTAGKIDYANQLILQLGREAGALDAQLKRYQEEINKVNKAIKKVRSAEAKKAAAKAAAQKPAPPKAQSDPHFTYDETKEGNEP